MNLLLIIAYFIHWYVYELVEEPDINLYNPKGITAT